MLAPCPCECKTDENIVCGKDGKTYLNQCLAKCLGGLGDGKDDKHKVWVGHARVDNAWVHSYIYTFLDSYLGFL